MRCSIAFVRASPRFAALSLVVVVAVACHGNAPRSTSDYAEARRSFRTKLVRQGASPQQAPPLALPADAREVPYRSGALTLRAWVSKTDATGARRPAVVYVHGGSAFGNDDWDQAKPFRDAGFVVMTPILRAENGQPGAYSLFYDEVDDVVAAAEALAREPGVDPARVFVAGHSNGGTLATLAAMASSRFRAAAALSGLTDASGLRGDPESVPFDQTNPTERRMRSAVAFAGSLQCPYRIYYGADERCHDCFEELAQLAQAAGRDAAAVRVPGNHSTMVQSAIPLAIALFAAQR
jgi:dipeptidyl aminopeptidase/acylaminoacyl peptidase